MSDEAYDILKYFDFNLVFLCTVNMEQMNTKNVRLHSDFSIKIDYTAELI